jgi:hypothetical protein
MSGVDHPTGGSITKKFTLKDQSRDQSCLPERRRARSPITSTARPIPAAAEQQQHYDDYQKQFHERSPLMVMSGDVCAGALFTSSNAPFNEPTTKLLMCRRIISNAHKAKGFRSHQTTYNRAERIQNARIRAVTAIIARVTVVTIATESDAVFSKGRDCGV